MQTTYNMLFVCTGNTCRSPMAEVLTRAEVARRGWVHVAVRSAGTHADPGAPAADFARRVVADRGLSLTEHRATQLDPQQIDWADIILTMSDAHLHTVVRLGGTGKADMLGRFANPDGGGDGVPDPFGGDLTDYVRTADALDALVSRALDRIAPIVSP